MMVSCFWAFYPQAPCGQTIFSLRKSFLCCDALVNPAYLFNLDTPDPALQLNKKNGIAD